MSITENYVQKYFENIDYLLQYFAIYKNLIREIENLIGQDGQDIDRLDNSKQEEIKNTLGHLRVSLERNYVMTKSIKKQLNEDSESFKKIQEAYDKLDKQNTLVLDDLKNYIEATDEFQTTHLMKNFLSNISDATKDMFE